MEQLLRTIGSVVHQLQEKVSVIFPVHANPKIQTLVSNTMSAEKNVFLVEPVDYPGFVALLSKVTVVLTDSGGIQEEAVSLGLPTLIMRNATERPEGVTLGGSKLIGTSSKNVEHHLIELLSNISVYQSMVHKGAWPYGIGDASQKIVHITALELSRHHVSEGGDFPLEDSESRFQVAGLGAGEPGSRVKLPGAISVILTVFKRPAELLRLQLRHILQQTLTPHEIFVFQNEAHVDIGEVLEEYPSVKHIHAKNINFRFHGRFLLPLMIDTEYVAIADDDVIPGKNWLRRATNLVSAHEALVGSEGRLIRWESVKNPNSTYLATQAKATDDRSQFVDFVGHWWVMKTVWIHFFWSVPHPTFFTGEDISLSATLQILGGKRSFVSSKMRKSPDDSPELLVRGRVSKKMLAASKRVASSKDPQAGIVRKALFRYWLKKGWLPRGIQTSSY